MTLTPETAPTPEPSSSPAALAEASSKAIDWAILLADDPDDAGQLEAFGIWLAASPLHRDVWARTQHLYAGLDKVQEQLYPQGFQLPSASKSAAPEVETSLPRWWQRLFQSASLFKPFYAASFAVVTGLLVVGVPYLKVGLQADFRTGTNELQTLRLDDGSTVFLAPDSAVDVSFSDNIRHIQLLKGRAFFEVQSNPQRPFVVDTDSARVTVLGTGFDVDNQGDATQVGVAHGRVQVDDKYHPLSPTQLTAGEQVAISPAQEAQLSQLKPDEIARWREHEFIARNLSISELVDAFRPYYQGVIVLRGDFAQTRVTGLYRLDNPIGSLTQIAQTQGASVKQLGPWVLVLSQ